MEYTKIRSPFQLDITNSPLDARTVVQTESDIMNISMPYVGMPVYCVDTGQRYTITELDSEVIIEGVFEVPDKKVKSYKLDTATINYRGEYTSSTPDNPADGDWFRNTTEGAAYIYQNNEWVLMAKDGAVGPLGLPGISGPAGQGINVKGVLDDVNDLPIAANSKNGDAYVVNGNLWVFGEDDTWYNAGLFKGDPGTSNFVDIRYSNDLESKQFETTGVYIGILVTDHYLQQPADFDLYTWSELAGTNTVFIYKHVEVADVPGKPKGNTIEEVALDGWTNDPEISFTSGYTWMSTAVFKNGSKLNDWTEPIRITGEQGQPGVDGDGIQFAYYLSESNTKRPNWDAEPNSDDNYYMSTFGWTNNPTGVSKEFRYEWVSVRYKKTVDGYKNWQGYQEPVVWASFGEDGSGVNYVYIRSEYELSVEDIQACQNALENWTSAEIEEAKTKGDTISEAARELGFTDEPSGVSDEYPYEYIASRKSTNGEWSLVYSDLVVWAKYGEKGADGTSAFYVDLDEQMNSVPCSADGSLLSGIHEGACTDMSALLPKFYVDDIYYGRLAIYHTNDVSGSNELTYLDPQIKSYRININVLDVGDCTFYEATDYLFFSYDEHLPYDVNDDWHTTGIITFNSFPENGWFELSILVGPDSNTYETFNIAIPIGNTLGESRFKTPITVKGVSMLGNNQLVDGMTYIVNSNGLITGNHTDSEGREHITIYGFTNKSITTGKFTLTAIYDGLFAHANYTLAKAYSGIDGKDGSGAEFEILLLKPETSAIQVVTDAFAVEAESTYPEAFSIYINTVTQDGVTTSLTVPAGYTVGVVIRYSGMAYNVDDQTYVNHEYLSNRVFSAGQDVIIDYISDYFEYSESGVVWKQIPKYFDISLNHMNSGTVVDLERIPFVASYKAPAADVPEWVNEWDGQTAKVDGNTMLTGKFYAGESPKASAEWSGVLIGNDVAEIEGLPWREEKSPFTGIIGLNGVSVKDDLTFDTPTYANVTFALDSTTGNSYFSGTAYDAKIDNCDITNCVVSSLRIVADLEDGSNNAVFGNGTINIFTKSPIYVEADDNLIYTGRDQNILTTIGYDPVDTTRIPSLRTSWYTPLEDDKYNPLVGDRRCAIDMGCELNGVLPYFEMFVRDEGSDSGRNYPLTTFPSELISEPNAGELSHIAMNGFGQVFSLNCNTLHINNSSYTTPNMYNPYSINSNSWGVTWINPTGVSVTRKINYDKSDPDYDEIYGSSYIDSVIKIGQFNLQDTYYGMTEFHGLLIDSFNQGDRNCAVVLPALSQEASAYDGWVFSCSLDDLVNSNNPNIQVLCIYRKQ